VYQSGAGKGAKRNPTLEPLSAYITLRLKMAEEGGVDERGGGRVKRLKINYHQN